MSFSDLQLLLLRKFYNHTPSAPGLHAHMKLKSLTIPLLISHFLTTLNYKVISFQSGPTPLATHEGPPSHFSLFLIWVSKQK